MCLLLQQKGRSSTLRSRRQAPRSSISRARVGTGRNVPLGAARPGYRRGTLGGSTKANLLYGSGEREHPEIPVGGVWGLAGCGMVRAARLAPRCWLCSPQNCSFPPKPSRLTEQPRPVTGPAHISDARPREGCAGSS